MHKVIFLTNKDLLYSPVTGGVQLCSQELLSVIKNSDKLQVQEYYVNFTRNVIDRIKIRAGLENYNMYDVKKDASQLITFIKRENIEIVFINMASAIRYAKPIKETFGEKITIILLSHGNNSGDFLHLISKPLKKESVFKQTIKKCRLGHLMSTESEYRLKYLDGVVAISETEKQIENWMNAPQTLFFPRFIKHSFLDHNPDLNKIGFVGRLDHPPNLQGIKILCNALAAKQNEIIKLRLVGAPVSNGQKLAAQYTFIEYLGELSDEALEKEVSEWSFFLNPVWWYSTGASTKLAKGISWGIPIATTTAGMRGYLWKEGNLLVADTPASMVDKIFDALNNKEAIINLAGETKKAAKSGPTLNELTKQIENFVLTK